MDKTINQYINQLHLDPKREAAVRKIVTLAGGSGGGGMVEVTYAELKELRDKGKLVPGCKYRMIDYETTTGQEGTQSAGHPFDLILTALDENTLDEKCSAIWSERDVDGYFANSNLPAWQVWYSLDNDASKYIWAIETGYAFEFKVIGNDFVQKVLATNIEEIEYNNTKCLKFIISEEEYFITNNTDITKIDTLYMYSKSNLVGTIPANILYINKQGGKGIIYRLIDENYNDIYYDFKNIQFNILLDSKFGYEIEKNEFLYIFSNIVDNTVIDSSLTNLCNNNTIKYVATEQEPDLIALEFNIFFNIEKKSINNEFIGSYNNIIIKRALYNKLLSSSNNILNDSHNNIIEYSSYNSLINNCNNNKLHNSFSLNLNEECTNNIFQNYDNHINLDYYSSYNVFEDSVQTITLYNCCYCLFKQNTYSLKSTTGGSNYIVNVPLPHTGNFDLAMKDRNFTTYICLDSESNILEYTDLDIRNAIQATKTES